MDAGADLEFGSYMPNVQVCVHWLWEECLPKDTKDVCVFLLLFLFVCFFFFGGGGGVGGWGCLLFVFLLLFFCLFFFICFLLIFPKRKAVFLETIFSIRNRRFDIEFCDKILFHPVTGAFLSQKKMLSLEENFKLRKEGMFANYAICTHMNISIVRTYTNKDPDQPAHHRHAI